MRTARLSLAVAFAGALVFALRSPADASMWVRTALDPAAPQVGRTVTVTVLTFSQVGTSGLCWDDPAVSPVPSARWYSGGSEPAQLQLKLFAAGPGSELVEASLAQRPGDGAYWDGSIVFPAAGEWTLRVSLMGAPLGSEQPWERCGGFARTVMVYSAGPGMLAAAGGGRQPDRPADAGGPVTASIAVVAAILVLVTLTRRLGRASSAA